MAKKRDDLGLYIESKRKADPVFDQAWQYRLLIRSLIKRRVELNMTQQEVADAMGVSRARVTEIEAGHKVMGADRLLSFVAALGLVLVPKVGPSPPKRAARSREKRSARSSQMHVVAEDKARYGPERRKKR